MYTCMLHTHMDCFGDRWTALMSVLLPQHHTHVMDNSSAEERSQGINSAEANIAGIESWEILMLFSSTHVVVRRGGGGYKERCIDNCVWATNHNKHNAYRVPREKGGKTYMSVPPQYTLRMTSPSLSETRCHRMLIFLSFLSQIVHPVFCINNFLILY